MPLIVECDVEGCGNAVEWDGEDFPVGWWEIARTVEVPPLRIAGLGAMPNFGQRGRVVAYLCPGHRPVRLKGERSAPPDEAIGPQVQNPPEWVAEVLKKEDGGT